VEENHAGQDTEIKSFGREQRGQVKVLHGTRDDFRKSLATGILGHASQDWWGGRDFVNGVSRSNSMTTKKWSEDR